MKLTVKRVTPLQEQRPRDSWLQLMPEGRLRRGAIRLGRTLGKYVAIAGVVIGFRAGEAFAQEADSVELVLTGDLPGSSSFPATVTLMRYLTSSPTMLGIDTVFSDLRERVGPLVKKAAVTERAAEGRS